MKTKRSFIALLLLFAYSIGFSHYLIPHTDYVDGLAFTSDSSPLFPSLHQHHSSVDAENIDSFERHDHVEHLGHFDEGIYDFLVCFLSKIEHPDKEDGQTDFAPGTKENLLQKKQFSYAPHIVFSFTSLHADLTILQERFSDEFSFHYSPPSLYKLSNKGPPLFSC